MQEKILEIIANLAGVEKDEVSVEDSFFEDLHMGASDLSDLKTKLSEAGYDSEKINFEEIELVGDLIEHFTTEEL